MVKLTTRATVEVCIKSQQMENRRAQCAEPEENAGRAITCPTKMLQEEKNLQLREKICAKPLKIQKRSRSCWLSLGNFQRASPSLLPLHMHAH